MLIILNVHLKNTHIFRRRIARGGGGGVATYSDRGKTYSVKFGKRTPE